MVWRDLYILVSLMIFWIAQLQSCFLGTGVRETKTALCKPNIYFLGVLVRKAKDELAETPADSHAFRDLTA
jgi:hypothetical protein